MPSGKVSAIKQPFSIVVFPIIPSFFHRNSFNYLIEIINVLQKSIYSTRQGRFEEALNLTEKVLEKAPNFPDALYLKTHILWQGFENATDARGCLKKVLKMVPREESLHRWASSYYDEIFRCEKESYIIQKQEKSKLKVKKIDL
jgi:tetratricopeptide (TPR) repeat protein